MATIHDVAEAAGVSISTVSYALSGKRSIAASTRQRVTEAVDRLGYRAHAGARMMAGARTNILALSSPVRSDDHQPTQMRFVTAVVEAARRHDYDVLLLATDDEVSGIRRVASSSLVDGVVALGVATEDERVALVRELDLPAGFIGIPQGVDDLACIDLDFEAAAAQSVDRLADVGHRVVGVVGHPASYRERDTGFIRRFDDAFAARAAARGVESVTIATDLSRASGGRALDELRERLPEMTALVLHCSEPTAESVLQRVRELGLVVPRDLSVLAACASYAADELEPALDMIPLPGAGVGRPACPRLLSPHRPHRRQAAPRTDRTTARPAPRHHLHPHRDISAPCRSSKRFDARPPCDQRPRAQPPHHTRGTT
jgi:DNA-binding LacI/PurR family transcriptional regulator